MNRSDNLLLPIRLVSFFLGAAVACTAAALGLPGGGNAPVIVDDFSTIAGGVFYDISADGGAQPNVVSTSANAGGVAILGSPEYLNSIFRFGGLAGPPADPGDGQGYIVWNAFPAATLDFDVPLTAFGVSFAHSGDTFADKDRSAPGRLQVYDGPGGTGRLIADILSAGTTPGGPNLIDFVGAWSDVPNIRSAVITSTGFDDQGRHLDAFVDGYGLSLTPAPEPASALLGALGIAVLLAGRAATRGVG